MNEECSIPNPLLTDQLSVCFKPMTHRKNVVMTKGDSPSMFRKWAMRQYWRMQQSQAVVGLLLWGTTITLRMALCQLAILRNV